MYNVPGTNRGGFFLLAKAPSRKEIVSTSWILLVRRGGFLSLGSCFLVLASCLLLLAYQSPPITPSQTPQSPEIPSAPRLPKRLAHSPQQYSGA